MAAVACIIQAHPWVEGLIGGLGRFGVRTFMKPPRSSAAAWPIDMASSAAAASALLGDGTAEAKIRWHSVALTGGSPAAVPAETRSATACQYRGKAGGRALTTEAIRRRSERGWVPSLVASADCIEIRWATEVWRSARVAAAAAARSSSSAAAFSLVAANLACRVARSRASLFSIFSCSLAAAASSASAAAASACSCSSCSRAPSSLACFAASRLRACISGPRSLTPPASGASNSSASPSDVLAFLACRHMVGQPTTRSECTESSGKWEAVTPQAGPPRPGWPVGCPLLQSPPAQRRA